MAGPVRFLVVAVGVAAALWIAAAAIGVSAAILANAAIVFGFFGVCTAAAVETLMKWRRKTAPAETSRRPAATAAASPDPVPGLDK